MAISDNDDKENKAIATKIYESCKQSKPRTVRTLEVINADDGKEAPGW